MESTAVEVRPFNYRMLTYVMQKHIDKLIDLTEYRYGARLKVDVRHNQGKGARHMAIRERGADRSVAPISHSIVFGSKCLKHYWEKGYREYKSLQWMMRGLKPTEGHAAYYIVSHEFAHAIQTRWGTRTYGSVYNASFVECYQFVLSNMPFDTEMKSLYETAVAMPSVARPVPPPVSPRVLYRPSPAKNRPTSSMILGQMSIADLSIALSGGAEW